jgi:hypothetical protein
MQYTSSAEQGYGLCPAVNPGSRYRDAPVTASKPIIPARAGLIDRWVYARTPTKMAITHLGYDGPLTALFLRGHSPNQESPSATTGIASSCVCDKFRLRLW